MQPLKALSTWLAKNTNEQHYLFSRNDLRPLFPEHSDPAFKVLLSRATQSKLLERVCRGIYLYSSAYNNDGLLLFHTAAILRAKAFNYISLETVLSEAGVISQIPINHITLLSSGRTNTFSCGHHGRIEFIHTNKKPNDIGDQLTYDQEKGMWKASIKLALQDMKNTQRNCDLINWEIANELI